MKITNKIEVAIFQWILQKLIEAGKYGILNFGTFQVKKRKGRYIKINGGSNVPERKMLIFKQSPNIREVLNK